MNIGLSGALYGFNDLCFNKKQPLLMNISTFATEVELVRVTLYPNFMVCYLYIS